MPEDMKDQVINETKASPNPMFFHVDESTDVTSCAQLLVFVRYILILETRGAPIFGELQTTTSADVREKQKSFDSAGLQMEI